MKKSKAESGTETQTVTGVMETGKIRGIFRRNGKSDTDTIGIEQVLKGR